MTFLAGYRFSQPTDSPCQRSLDISGASSRRRLRSNEASWSKIWRSPNAFWSNSTRISLKDLPVRFLLQGSSTNSPTNSLYLKASGCETCTWSLWKNLVTVQLSLGLDMKDPDLVAEALKNPDKFDLNYESYRVLLKPYEDEWLLTGHLKSCDSVGAYTRIYAGVAWWKSALLGKKSYYQVRPYAVATQLADSLSLFGLFLQLLLLTLLLLVLL